VHRSPVISSQGNIGSFGDKETELIFHGSPATGSVGNSARRRIPPNVWKTAQRTLDKLNASTMQELASVRGNNLEKLKGNYQGHFSIRVNDQYRLVFRFQNEQFRDVRILDYH
jgi:toxin HigB-1